MTEREFSEVKPEDYYSSPETYLEKADREDNRDQFSDFLEIREEFAERLSGDEKLLDAGCGPGPDAEFFNRHIEEYIGVDISEENILFAKRNEPGRFEISDTRDLEFEDSYFDAIWNSASLFFMPPDEMAKALDEFERVLSEGGLAFLSWKEGEGSNLKGEDEKVREYYISEDEAESMINERFTVLEKFRNDGRNQDFISFVVKK